MAEVSFMSEVVRIEELKHVSDKLRKCEFVVREVRNDGRDNILRLQGLNSMADLVKDLVPLSRINVTCYLEGREWTNSEGKVLLFMNLTVKDYKVMDDGSAKRVKQAESGGVDDMAYDGGGEDDLPF